MRVRGIYKLRTYLTRVANSAFDDWRDQLIDDASRETRRVTFRAYQGKQSIYWECQERLDSWYGKVWHNTDHGNKPGDETWTDGL